ncbi:MAG: hypothetical protein OK439_02645 [Thaumarchaeota archaeon]|nr:hypothetical protein [Nitrososphaerota archaeon]
MSARMYDDFMLLERKDQEAVLAFEENVVEWSDDQLRLELSAIRPAFQLLCTLAIEESEPSERMRLVYHSRRIDLQKTIMENEIVRRELR